MNLNRKDLDAIAALIRGDDEGKNIVITGTETSGDGAAWAAQENISLAGLLENIARGERIFVRSHYVEKFPSGKTSLPKTGPIYEITAVQMQAPRLIPLETQPTRKTLKKGGE